LWSVDSLLLLYLLLRHFCALTARFVSLAYLKPFDHTTKQAAREELPVVYIT
jgi:hypothetical protein